MVIGRNVARWYVIACFSGPVRTKQATFFQGFGALFKPLLQPIRPKLRIWRIGSQIINKPTGNRLTDAINGIKKHGSCFWSQVMGLLCRAPS